MTSKKTSFYWAWWHTLTITASQSLRQEYHKFQASLFTKQKELSFWEKIQKVVSRSNDVILNNI